MIDDWCVPAASRAAGLIRSVIADTFHVCQSRRVKVRVRRTLTRASFDTETAEVHGFRRFAERSRHTRA
jgi:hypothetical protein